MAQSNDGVPTETNIVYIDQTEGGSGGVTFSVYPSGMVDGGTYYIYVAGNGTTRTAIASFTYYAPYPKGDINEDKRVNSTDALWALQIYAESRKDISAAQRARADVNGDGRVNSTDALWILQAYAGTRSL